MKYDKCKVKNCTGLGQLRTDGTNKRYFNNGYCVKHDKKNKKYGNPLFSLCVRGENRHKNQLYDTYNGMKQRCLNPNDKRYEYYGGRGISICKRWLGLNGFNKFMEDMGARPSANHTLDRKNNNKGYCKGNCRWATKHEQSANRRNNHLNIGVRFRPDRNRWAACLAVNKKVYRKQFKTEQEAIEYRKHLEKIHLHGS